MGCASDLADGRFLIGPFSRASFQVPSPEKRRIQKSEVTQGRMSPTFQSVAPSDYFKFAPDCVHDRDHGVHLEHKCREHGAKFVNRQWIVAFHQHMPTPLAHTNYEKLDLEIGWRLPLAKHLEDSLLSVLILYRRTLRAFKPADYAFHAFFSFGNGLTDHSASLYSQGDRFSAARRSGMLSDLSSVPGQGSAHHSRQCGRTGL